MAAPHDRFAQWWDAQQPPMRALARTAARTGAVDADLEQSLRRAGLLPRDRRPGDPLPPDLVQRLKARH